MATYTSYNPLYEDDPKQVAMKTRILTHMTADHADSLALFLKQYCKQPINIPASSEELSKLSLSDIQLTHMIISHPKGRSLIPFDPPMQSFSESRARLVQMHTEALRALGLSDLKIDTFVLPNKAWQWLIQFACILSFSTFTLYPSAAFLPEANTLASKIWSFGGLAPWNARLASYLCKPVVIAMVLIHAAEVVWFQQTRLRRYWVPTGTLVWWMWIVAAFNGGVGAIFRFDDMVADIRKEKEMKEKGKGKDEQH